MHTTTRAIGLVLATTTLGVAGCNRADDRGTATNRDGTVDSAGAMNTGGTSANAMTQDTAGDQSIAAVLATIDRSEIQSSRVALQKAASGDVKRYAQKMIDEHVRTSQQLATLARNGNFMIPDTAQLDRNLGVMEGGSMGGGASGGMGASGTGGGMSGGSGGSRTTDASGSRPGSAGNTSAGAAAGGAGNTGTSGSGSAGAAGSGAAGASGSSAAGTSGSGGAGMSGGTTASTGNPVGTGSAASGSGRGEAMRPDSAGGSSRGNATMAPDAILQELHRDAQAAMATLRPLRGAAFDRAYMDAQVAMHTKSLSALGNLSASARDQQLRAHIDMVTRHVQEHLQEGQQLRQRLGGGAR